MFLHIEPLHFYIRGSVRCTAGRPTVQAPIKMECVRYYNNLLVFVEQSNDANGGSKTDLLRTQILYQGQDGTPRCCVALNGMVTFLSRN